MGFSLDASACLNDWTNRRQFYAIDKMRYALRATLTLQLKLHAASQLNIDPQVTGLRTNINSVEY